MGEAVQGADFQDGGGNAHARHGQAGGGRRAACGRARKVPEERHRQHDLSQATALRRGAKGVSQNRPDGAGFCRQTSSR